MDEWVQSFYFTYIVVPHSATTTFQIDLIMHCGFSVSLVIVLYIVHSLTSTNDKRRALPFLLNTA